MFSLPTSTEKHKPIPKKLIFSKFADELTGAGKTRFDTDIARIAITNEISPNTINISDEEQGKAIYVLQLDMKTKNFDERNLVLLAKLIGQNLVFALRCENEYSLAVYLQKLFTSPWLPEEPEIPISGLSLKSIWENIIRQISGYAAEQGKTLEEQIIRGEEKKKLQKEIENLEKKLRKEVQANKKHLLHRQIKALREKL